MSGEERVAYGLNTFRRDESIWHATAIYLTVSVIRR